MLLLATETWRSPGGIQRYMRILCQILTSKGRGVITLLDHPQHRPAECDRATCCAGGRWRFCFAFAAELWHTPRSVTIVGHTSLLPVIWILRRLRLLDAYAVVLHGIEAWRRLPWPARAAAREASAVVATTQYTAREFCYYNQVNANKCVIIPLSNSLSFDISAKPPLDPFRLVTVTRLSRADSYKGVDFALQALRLARHSGLRLTFEIIGDGDDRRRLEDLTQTLEIQDIVKFRGRAGDEAVKDTLVRSHLFVLPSKKEGFGFVYLEAMAASLPCIAANHGGVPEAVEHGENGFLVEYGDVRQMAFYYRTLAESPKLYLQMSEAARRRAENFSQPRMVHSWNNLITRLENVRGVASA
jgi:phosphatidyl-myo-inositol dimannoside synthase